MNTKKYIAEFIGTFTLTLFGCGSAALSGGIDGKLGILGISMAFGLSIVAMAYAIGDISGCHINPAVSLAMLISKKLDIKDFVGYVIAQILGGIVAAGVLSFIINSSSNLGSVAEVGLGQNGFGSASYVGLSMGGAIVVEIILTFVFLMTILGVTAKAKTGTVAGLVIGLCLAFVHILGIPLTGTSVNPARSFGPALLLGGQALSQVWVFIAAPLIGAALAAVVWNAVCKTED
ncbi:MIP family channel protein [Blautia schinkii]|nr:MIP family channel protein [Blautia schinkii]